MRSASGSIFGLAYGDSLGKPTEFQRYEDIVAAHGRGGPRELVGAPALVTDDTQMMLAVGEGVLAAPSFAPEALAEAWRDAFVAWSVSPDNNRAPGMTCLRACAALSEGKRWQDATQIHSKGCGANMRVTPIALVTGRTDEERAGAAQLQAALTHGHPTGLAAAELTAFATLWLRDGMPAGDLLAALRQRCADQRDVYHERWLGDLWQVAGAPSPEAFIRTGWQESAAALDRIRTAPLDHDGDPCRYAGEGWIAEEALAAAVYCYLLAPDDPVAALGRGAASSGDSDSIACLAGAFAGAALGMAAWPAEWAGRIEYADRLTRLGAAWD